MNYKSIDWAFAFCLMFFLTLFYSGYAAAEDGSDAIATVLCKVVQELQGTIGKAIATIGVVVLGVGLFMGKISWPVAAATAVGIGLIFGSANLVQFFGAGMGSTITSGCS